MPEGEIDRPNTASFVKKVAFRDGLKCANPHCQRKDHLHSHHLIFRSKGGRTVLINAILLCLWCHAAVHQGLLVIEGNPLTGLTFTTRPDKLNLALEAEKDELVAISQIGVLDAAHSKPPEGAQPPAQPPETVAGVDNLPIALEAEKNELVAISQLGVPATAPPQPSDPAKVPGDPQPAAPESQSAERDCEHVPPRPRWGAPGDSGIPESQVGRPPSSKAREADLRLTLLALKKLGYTAAEATERVGEAVRRLEGRRGPVRAEEILRAALGARLAPDTSNGALQDSG